VTFENVQAGERTSHLFRLANLHGGRVVETSDLSELALGYTTYGVGDHMAHYSVNASELIRWTAHADERSAPTRDVLAILATTISPELVPGSGEAPAQSAEAEGLNAQNQVIRLRQVRPSPPAQVRGYPRQRAARAICGPGGHSSATARWPKRAGTTSRTS
jgi:hypothetical protein